MTTQRRMGTLITVVTHVLPDVPLRQSVVTVPFPQVSVGLRRETPQGRGCQRPFFLDRSAPVPTSLRVAVRSR